MTSILALRSCWSKLGLLSRLGLLVSRLEPYDAAAAAVWTRLTVSKLGLLSALGRRILVPLVGSMLARRELSLRFSSPVMIS